MGLILTRSPFHISRGNLDANASLAIDIYTYELGVSTIKNSYNMIFRGRTHIDISNFIRSEFIPSYTYNSSTDIYDESSSDTLMVEITLSGQVDGVDVADTVTRYYATEGYLWSTDDFNEDLSSELSSNGFYAGSTSLVYKEATSSLRLPFVNTSLTSLFENKIVSEDLNSTDNWDLQTADDVTDGVVYFDGNGSRAYEGFEMTTGSDYLLTFEIKNVYGGDVSIYDGTSGTVIASNLSDERKFTFEFTQSATPSQNVLTFIGADGFDGEIHDLFLGEKTSSNYEEITINGKWQGSQVVTTGLTFNSYTDKTIQYVNFNVDDLDKIEIVTDSGTTELDVLPIVECKYNPFIITFKNRYGAEEDLWFFKKSQKSLKVSSDEFMANQFQRRTSNGLIRSKQEYNKNGTVSITLNSGFVPEEFNQAFEQLMLSEEVKLYDYVGLEEYAVKIVNSSFNYKTSTNDKLINYEIEVELSNNTIDNIV